MRGTGIFLKGKVIYLLKWITTFTRGSTKEHRNERSQSTVRVHADLFKVDSLQIGHPEIGQPQSDGSAWIRRLSDLRTVNCTVILISGTALSWRKRISGRFSVRSDSFCRQNVQRLTGSSCNRGSFKRGFPLPLIEVQLEVMDSKARNRLTRS
jgi:hypothetical protein